MPYGITLGFLLLLQKSTGLPHSLTAWWGFLSCFRVSQSHQMTQCRQLNWALGACFPAHYLGRRVCLKKVIEKPVCSACGQTATTVIYLRFKIPPIFKYSVKVFSGFKTHYSQIFFKHQGSFELTSCTFHIDIGACTEKNERFIQLIAQ